MNTIRKYPKLCLLGLSIVAAYALFAAGGLHWLHGTKGSSELMAAFLGGILFTFGFTTPFGIGVFVEIGTSVNPILGSLIGGFGALLADLTIFQVMRFEFFHEEIYHLKSTRIAQWMHSVIHHDSFPEKFRRYLLWAFAGIIIASPVPDEFGVALVSSIASIDRRAFAALSFICNTAGILVIILMSRAFA